MLENILFIGSLGSLLFTFFLVVISLSGWVKHVRNEEGEFRKKWNWKGITGLVLFISLLMGILVWGNYRIAKELLDDPTAVELFLNGFGIFFFIHLYDLIIIDYILIVCWHPKFLNLPKTDYYKTLKPHITGFFKGIPIGIIASILAAYLFFLFP